MKNELLIGVVQHEPNKILNPTFKLGDTGWKFTPDMDTHYIYDNICFLGKETDAEATYGMWIENAINTTGIYKCTFEIFENEEVPGGDIEVHLGDATYTASTLGTHTFIAVVNDDTSKILSFNNYTNSYRGITNVTLESTDVNYVNIDLISDITIPLTFNIADIKDFSKKNASFSKTIQIPGTANNNIFFKHIYDITSTGTYILNKAVPCRLFQDTQNVFNGKFELTKVIINANNDYIYEGNIYSPFLSLFTVIGNKLIVGNDSIADNIPLSEFSHVKTASVVKDSLDTVIADKLDTYSYVFIDKDGRYQYKYDPQYSFTVQQMTAALPIKTILDKIFNKAGYKYESSFFNSDNFKHLIMPYPDHDMYYSQDMIDKYSAEGSNTANTVVAFTIPSSTGGSYGINYDTIEYTPTENVAIYNGGNFTAKIGGTYKITIDKPLKFRLSCNPLTIPDNVYDYIDEAWLTTRTPFGSTFYFSFKLNLAVTRNGVQTIEHLKEWTDQFNAYLPDQASYDAALDPLRLVHRYEGGVHYLENIFSTFDSFNKDFDLLAGDEAYLFTEVINHNTIPATRVMAYTDSQLYQTDVNWRLETYSDAESFNFELQPIKKEGAYIYGSDIPHQKMKQSDFLTSIIKMFNLYVEPIDETTLRIEPRDDYYTNFGTLKDWTDKVSADKEITYERPSDLIEKVLILKYDDDEDTLNKTYLSNTLMSYGSEVVIEPQNKDLSDISEIKLTFASTVCGPLEDSSRVLLPKIYALKDDGSIDTTKKFKPRILQLQDVEINTAENVQLVSMNVSESVTYSGYLPNYVSHFNKPYGDEDWNINFGQLKWNYEQITWPAGVGETFANLNNLYYQKMFEQIVHEDAKLVTLYVNLLPTDVADLSLADTIQIQSQKYNINKISDYVPGQATKVELLKIIDVSVIDVDYEPIVKQFDGEKIFDTPVVLPTTINVIPIVNEVPTIPVITELPKATDINNGQLAVNTVDKKVYIRMDNEIAKFKTSFDPDTSGSVNIEDILYADLFDKYSSGSLSAGQFYNITDYATVHYMLDGDFVYPWSEVNTGVNEPLIVFATSNSTLDKQAFSAMYPGDIIYYDITAGVINSDASIWGDYTQPAIVPGFKGFITYREDTIQNVKCQYDFRNVKFYRYQIDCDLTWVYPNTYTDFTTNTLVEYSGGYYKCLVEFGPGESTIAPDVDWKNWAYIGAKDRNLYWSIDWIPQTLFNNFYVGLSNVTSVYTFGDYYNRVYNVEIGTSNNVTRFNDIVFYTTDDPDTCRDNIIKSGNKVTFGTQIYNNNIDIISSCFVYDGFYFNNLICGYNNTICGSFTYNNIEKNFQGNNICENFQHNTIGNFFYGNVIGSEFYNNKIVFNMHNNKIYTNCNNNTIGSSFTGNVISNYFINNTIGNDFINNSINTNFNSNQIGKYFGTFVGCSTNVGNTIGDNFTDNHIGNNFYSNAIGSNFKNNKIDNTFHGNTIANYFQYNNIASGFIDNYLMLNDYFQYNNFKCPITYGLENEPLLYDITNVDINLYNLPGVVFGYRMIYINASAVLTVAEIFTNFGGDPNDPNN